MDTYNHTLVDAAVEGVRLNPVATGYAEPTPPPDWSTPLRAHRREMAEQERANQQTLRWYEETYPTPDIPPGIGNSGGIGQMIGQKIGQKGWCSGDSHFYTCKHETVCQCGQTGRITVAPGL